MIKYNPSVVFTQKPPLSRIRDRGYPIKIVFNAVEIPVLCFSVEEARNLRTFLLHDEIPNRCFNTSQGKYWFEKTNYFDSMDIASVNTQDIITLSYNHISSLCRDLESVLKKQSTPIYIHPDALKEIQSWDDPMVGAKRRTDENLRSIFE